jgi:hypothetical protein
MAVFLLIHLKITRPVYLPSPGIFEPILTIHLQSNPCPVCDKCLHRLRQYFCLIAFITQYIREKAINLLDCRNLMHIFDSWYCLEAYENVLKTKKRKRCHLVPFQDFKVPKSTIFKRLFLLRSDS